MTACADGVLPPLTGEDSRIAEVRDVPFPKLLDPVDDLPPNTVITHLIPSSDSLLVRGTSSDNGTIAKVIVNGVQAKATRPNFAEWEVSLSGVKSGAELRAHAEDAAGNVEKTPHVMVWRGR